MASNSKYQDQQINQILAEMTAVLEKHQAPVDLSLMVLGNMVTHVLTHSVGRAQSAVLAKAFSEALFSSIQEQK